MSGEPRHWLVAYDVTDDKRRNAVYRTLRGFGDHVQFSVFRCVLSELRFAELRAALVDIIQHDVDQIILVPLGGPQSPAVLGTITLGAPIERIEEVVRIL